MWNPQVACSPTLFSNYAQCVAPNVPISIHLKFQMHIKQLLCTAVLYFSYIKRKCVSVKFTFVPMCLWENRGTEYIYILTLSLELVMIFPSQVMAPTAVASFQSGLSRWRVWQAWANLAVKASLVFWLRVQWQSVCRFPYPRPSLCLSEMTSFIIRIISVDMTLISSMLLVN